MASSTSNTTNFTDITVYSHQWSVISVTKKNLNDFHDRAVTIKNVGQEEDINFWRKPVMEILEEVKNKDDRFKLNVINSGSYYEKTKVKVPNEFDLMLDMEKLTLGECDLYDSYEDNLTRDPPIGFTTILIDQGEECEWRKDGCIAKEEHLLKATKIKALFAKYVREAIKKLDNDFVKRYNIKEIKVRSHGPTVTLGVIHYVKASCCIDLTLAIKDNTWPEDAEEWKTRPRKGWPPKELIDDIVKDGCHLVGKRPKPASAKESEYLWRYSFSTAEMKLVSKLEPCWKKVLRILKAFREEYVELTPFTSYHLKTIMFYEREVNPDSSLWAEDQLNVRFRRALDTLVSCLLNKRCPHYFMKDVNLFEEKFGDVHYKKLISRITVIQRHPNAFLEKVLKKVS